MFDTITTILTDLNLLEHRKLFLDQELTDDLLRDNIRNMLLDRLLAGALTLDDDRRRFIAAFSTFDRDNNIGVQKREANIYEKQTIGDVELTKRGQGRRESDSEALQILKFESGFPKGPLEVKFDEPALESILKKTGSRRVAVLAVAGPTRSGKSFFLNFVIRRLQSLAGQGDKCWTRDTPLTGFAWESSYERVTDGIWIWSEPFTLESKADGSKFDVILVDTQGVFDDTTGPREWSILMGLSLLTSSCLVYNTSKNIDEKELGILDGFLSFGLMALQDENNIERERPFQRIVFLVRDWNTPRAFPYGSKGGENFIAKKLSKCETHQADSVYVRENIIKCFDSIYCTLLPHPGQDALKENFNGSISNCGTFAKEMESCVEDLFKGEFPTKTINGNHLTGPELLQVFKTYVEMFQKEELQNANSMYYTTSKACNSAVVSLCRSNFMKEVEQQFKDVPFPLETEMNEFFKAAKGRAIKIFECSRLMGSQILINEAGDVLEKEFDTIMTKYVIEMDSKVAVAHTQALHIYVSSLEKSFSANPEFFVETEYQSISDKAQADALDLFKRLLIPAKPQSIQKKEVVLVQALQKQFLRFQCQNNKKKSKAEKKIQNEVEEFTKTYKLLILNHIGEGILPTKELTVLLEKTSSAFKSEFSDKYLPSPLLPATLELLQSKLEAEGNRIEKAMRIRLEEAESAKKLLAHSLQKYTQGLHSISQSFSGNDQGEFKRIEREMRESAINMLENSGDVLPPDLKSKCKSELRSKIDEAYTAFLSSIHESTLKGVSTAKETARSTYEAHLSNYCDQNLMLIVPEKLQEMHKVLASEAASNYAETVKSLGLLSLDYDEEVELANLSASIEIVFQKQKELHSRRQRQVKESLEHQAAIISGAQASAIRAYKTKMDEFMANIEHNVPVPKSDLQAKHEIEKGEARKKFTGMCHVAKDSGGMVQAIKDFDNKINDSYDKIMRTNADLLQSYKSSIATHLKDVQTNSFASMQTVFDTTCSPSHFAQESNKIGLQYEKLLTSKINVRLVGRQFLSDQIKELHEFIQDKSKELLHAMRFKIKFNEIALKMAHTEAAKYYNGEMEKKIKSKPWFTITELSNMNKEAISAALAHCKENGVEMTKLVETQVREAMAVVYQKYSEDNTLNSPMGNIGIGIDLGTTYCCVAVYHKGKVEIIPDREMAHGTTIPSYVAFNPDRTISVGEPAKNQASANPQNTIFNAKRLIGRNFSDTIVQKDMKLWPFTVVGNQGRPTIKVDVKVDDVVVHQRTFRPEEISAKLLYKMKRMAEDYLNKDVKEAVVTVPAYFNNAQRQATRDAAEIAGLKVRILNEPTSAAIAYKLHRTDELKTNVLIFDLGGGTFDVAVLEIRGKNIKVLAIGGDTHLGGEDFDNAIVNCIVERVKIKPNGRDLARGRNSTNSTEKAKASTRLCRLRDACEVAKKNLSSSDCWSTEIVIPMIDEDFNLKEILTTEEFENLNSSHFKMCMKVVTASLQDAKLEKTEIDEIVLVGGSTRIPKIQQLLKELFENDKELSSKIHPEEAVARGAAIYAALLHGDPVARLRDNFKLSDVNPLSLGIREASGKLVVIIPKNTAVPCSITKLFQTAQSNQTSFEIIIYEGENLNVADANNCLGRFSLMDIPPGPAGTEKFDCTMTVNEEGILNIRAESLSKGIENEITIGSDTNHMTKREIKAAQTQDPIKW